MNRSLFRIATFNVNSIRTRLPIVLQWLREHQPDALCLQETKVEDKDFPLEPFREAGFHVAFRGQKRWNGVAIVSKEPLVSVAFGLEDGSPEEQARMIRGVLGGVTIVNTYVPQGRDVADDQFAYKIGWFERLRALFETQYRPEDRIVWCGDLNHAPEASDVYDPKRLFGHVCFHPDVDRAFRRILAWGFADVFRKHCPDPGQYTFYDYRLPNAVKRGLGWRLDHILATFPLAARSIRVYIDLAPRLSARPSDHTPLVAEFQTEGSASRGGT